MSHLHVVLLDNQPTRQRKSSDFGLSTYKVNVKLLISFAMKIIRKRYLQYTVNNQPVYGFDWHVVDGSRLIAVRLRLVDAIVVAVKNMF